jgi:hypothetical protein
MLTSYMYFDLHLTHWYSLWTYAWIGLWPIMLFFWFFYYAIIIVVVTAAAWAVYFLMEQTTARR